MIENAFVDIEEYQKRYAGRLYGIYAGVVKDTQDPRQLGRIKALVPNVYGDDLSPWCTPCFPGGVGVDSGDIKVPREHQYVWITFEEGDPRSPIYLGGFAINTSRGRGSDNSALENSDVHQDNSSPLPLHAQGLPDGTDTEGTTNDYRNIPPSSFGSEYGKVQINRTESGHVIELNDTTDATRIFISHGPSGAYYEIRHDGTIVESTSGFKRTLDSGIYSVHEGSSTFEFDDRVNGTFGGQLSFDFLSSASFTFPNQTLSVDSGLKAHLTDVNISSDSNILLSSLGVTSLEGADGLNVSCGSNRVDTVVGSFEMNTMNAFDPTGLLSTLILEGMNGLVSVKASDRLGLSSKGIEAIETGLPNGGDVVIGDLTTPSETRRSPVSVPIIKEGVVMGTQLQTALVSLISIFETYAGALSTGGSTPGFGGPNPVLATANKALLTSLTTWATKFTTPLPPRSQPIFASNSVFVTK